jgi:hypothetical protein
MTKRSGAIARKMRFKAKKENRKPKAFRRISVLDSLFLILKLFKKPEDFRPTNFARFG